MCYDRFSWFRKNFILFHYYFFALNSKTFYAFIKSTSKLAEVSTKLQCTNIPREFMDCMEIRKIVKYNKTTCKIAISP